MDTIVDDTSSRLAATLRAEREARGWSQGDLARRSGVSKAMISKIERAESSPTAVILVRLSAALELTLAGLLSRSEGAGGRHMKAAAQSTWQDPETSYLRRQLFANPTHPVEIAHIELPPRARVPFPAESYRFIRQAVWLMKGALVIEEGGERHELAAGDAYGFGEPADSAFVNPSKVPCTYIVVASRR